jgi:hypothetical protein
MRRAAVLVLFLALGGVLVAGLGSAGTAQTAKLRVVAVNPLAVAGTGFHAGEQVLVTATSAGRLQAARVTATRVGSFRVALDGLTPSRCDLIRVIAVRRGANRVVLKRLPSPACLPERSSA